MPWGLSTWPPTGRDCSVGHPNCAARGGLWRPESWRWPRTEPRGAGPGVAQPASQPPQDQAPQLEAGQAALKVEGRLVARGCTRLLEKTAFQVIKGPSKAARTWCPPAGPPPASHSSGLRTDTGPPPGPAQALGAEGSQGQRVGMNCGLLRVLEPSCPPAHARGGSGLLGLLPPP